MPLGGFFVRFGASPVSWATQLSGLDDVGIGISRNLTVGAVLFWVWLFGAVFMLARLLLGVRRDRRDARVAAGQDSPRLRQMFLAQAELDAVLIHEVIHARRRDNLVGLLHELALCGPWFHPLVWLTGFRLAIFRERVCYIKGLADLIPGADFKAVWLSPSIALHIIGVKPNHGSGQSVVLQHEAQVVKVDRRPQVG